ncbi:MAG: hypothetical protein WCR02_00955 [Sphaerochaetaceae bacterium]
MRRTLSKEIGIRVLVLSLIIPLSGCDMALTKASRERITDAELLPTVARIIDDQKDVIQDYLGDDLSREVIEGQDVVRNALSEEQGREYLEFCYAVNNSTTQEDADAVVEYARTLLPEKEMAELEEKIESNKSVMMSEAEVYARALSPSLRAPFWKDMQKLVVKATVLFAAGIVYACIPHVVIWGKVAAAAAIAVAAGVVAATVMSLIRYYKFGGEKGESFNEWLTSVTTEPKTSYALAASMIAVGSTLKRSPLITGIIICVFALYGIVDDVKPLLTKYNFKV